MTPYLFPLLLALVFGLATGARIYRRRTGASPLRLTNPELRKRVGDRGPLGWWRAFYDEWGAVLQLALGFALFFVAIVVLVVSLQVRQLSASSDQAAQTAREQSAIARRQAHVQCVRTRAFSPSVAKFYEREHVLTPEQLVAYSSTIPTACP